MTFVADAKSRFVIRFKAQSSQTVTYFVLKCDEQRPRCGPCKKKNRSCTYSRGEGSQFVHQAATFFGPANEYSSGQGRDLETSNESLLGRIDTAPAYAPSRFYLKSSKATPHGNGIFVTLAPKHLSGRRIYEGRLRHSGDGNPQSNGLSPRSAVGPVRCSASLLRTPSCAESLLASRWVSVVARDCSTYERMQIFGPWIPLMVHRIGNSPLVDLAATYFIEGVTFHCTGTDQSLQVARATNAKVLKHLRHILASTSQDDRRNALFASRVIADAEVRVNLRLMLVSALIQSRSLSLVTL